MHTLIRCISDMGAGKPSDASFQTVMHATLRFLKSSELCGIPFVPKFHHLVHLVWDTQETGDVKITATYFDESLNKELGSVCGLAYESVFHARVLLYMREVLKKTRARGALGPYRSWLVAESQVPT